MPAFALKLSGQLFGRQRAMPARLGRVVRFRFETLDQGLADLLR